MLERMPQEVSYLYILKPPEFLVLVGVAVALAAAGYALFRWWYERDKVPPLWAIGIVAILALALYLVAAIPIWVRADTYRKLTVILYSVVIWAIPGAALCIVAVLALAAQARMPLLFEPRIPKVRLRPDN